MTEVLNLEFWGVRGTCPVSGKNWCTYGGHTPCSSLEPPDGSILIIDAGTGIKQLGDKFQKKKSGQPTHLHLFLTHFHLDHIMGLPFFMPLYSPDVTLTFYADCSPQKIEEYLSGFMGERYFPISFMETQSKKIFKQVHGGGIEIGKNHISLSPLHHPQGSVAYKIQSDRDTLVFATDTEHPPESIDRRLADFSAGADVLVYDAMFTPEEYESGKRGWGHSTWLEGTKLAKESGVKKLYLSHFNPDHSDDQLDVITALAREQFEQTSPAREESG
jgi:phosphoribosyl 1,2-cyclic phosphodiesterase